MTSSDAVATLDYYAQQLAELKDVLFPIHLCWQLSNGREELSVRPIYYRGKHHVDALGFNHYGDEACWNQVYFFRQVGREGDFNWQITILKWDDPNRPIEWLLNAPARYRVGFPSIIEGTMRQLIDRLFEHAKEHLGYQTEDELKQQLMSTDNREYLRAIIGRLRNKERDCE